MSVEDKQIWRLLQHELYRRQNIDVSEVRLIVQRGVAVLAGSIRPLPATYVDFKEEMRIFQEQAHRIPGLRGLSIECQFIQSAKR